MPTYSITGPDDKTYSIEGPEGATREQVIAKIKERQQGMSLGRMATEAVTNIPSSALEFGKNIVQPIIHPVETAKGLGSIGQGLVEKAFKPYGPELAGTGEHEKYVDAVKDFFVQRYGSVDNFKKTVAKDPVGVLGDIASVFSGGGAVLKGAGTVGKVGKVLEKVGEVTNPLAVPIKAAEKSGDILAQVIGNLGTHTGGESLSQAFKAGVAGGNKLESFYESMRNSEVNMDRLAVDARAALGKMREEKSAEYVKGLQQVGKNPTVLKFDDIDKALGEAKEIKSFEGQPISKLAGEEKAMPAEAIQTRLAKAVDAWRAQDPTRYHTALGFDALKKFVYDVMADLPYNSPQRLVAEKVYKSIWETIVKQDPNYAKVMKGYEEASKQIDEITKSLSIGRKAATDTALRKLLSATRSNVNTNFGKRADLVKTLSEKGAPNLMSDIAGHALSPITPQGLGKLTAGGAGLGAIAANPLLALTLPFTSPRLMGEAAAALGRGVGAIPESLRGVGGKINPQVLEKALLAARLAGKLPQSAELHQILAALQPVVYAQKRESTQ